MTKKLTIRSKLALALAVPLVGLATLVALQARDAQGEGSQVVYLAAAGGAVLFSIGVLVLANRWITRPLSELAEEARVMAGERLPAAVRQILETPRGAEVAMPEVEPVHVRGGAEIAGAVEALNLLQRAALEHAVEQAMLRRVVAESFVNLGRRNQNLLARQLELITRLEAEESDPEALEHLFALDHLATRMRRNAESLLVLAGEEPARKWNQPVPIGDVVRAALGEVEQYARVQLHPVDGTTIVGSAVADVSHVLAELIENACAFSPPHTTVDVYARRAEHGLIVTIVDSGIGMPEEEIARANERLRADQSFAIAPSRYLGHYVVANLAARHGIEVGLQPSPSGGITATVVLPVSVLADREPPAAAPGAGDAAATAVSPAPYDAEADGALPAASAPVGAAPVPAAGPEDVAAVEALVVEEPEPPAEVVAAEAVPEVPVSPAAPAEIPVAEVPVARAAPDASPAGEAVAAEPPAAAPEPPAPPVAPPRPTAAATFALMRDLAPGPQPRPAPAAPAVPAAAAPAEPGTVPVETDEPAGAPAASAAADERPAAEAAPVELAIAAPIQDDLLPQARGRRHGRRGRGHGPRVAPVPPQVLKIAASAPPVAAGPAAGPATGPATGPAPGAPAAVPPAVPSSAPPVAAAVLSDLAAAAHAGPPPAPAAPPAAAPVPAPPVDAAPVAPAAAAPPAPPAAAGTAPSAPAPADAAPGAPPPLPRRGVDMAPARVWERAPEPAADDTDDDAAAPAPAPNYALFAAFRAAAERGRADATGGGR
ncbi:MAG: hypothetical protein KatS3mg009_0972 [Acidimicrobiia bacterium]|nr:MAG: hypothetical protein KatS3mg009_0972 [Acidimicrobiia bacterium]